MFLKNYQILNIYINFLNFLIIKKYNKKSSQNNQF